MIMSESVAAGGPGSRVRAACLSQLWPRRPGAAGRSGSCGPAAEARPIKR
jgi:hypothetical protein